MCITGTPLKGSKGRVQNNYAAFTGAIRVELGETDGEGANNYFCNYTKTGQDVVFDGNIGEYAGENNFEGRATFINNVGRVSGFYSTLTSPSKENMFITAESTADNNILIDSADRGIYVYTTVSKSNLSICNNKVYSPKSTAISLMADGAQISQGYVAHNRIYGENDPTKSGISLVGINGGHFSSTRAHFNKLWGRTSNTIPSSVESKWNSWDSNIPVPPDGGWVETHLATEVKAALSLAKTSIQPHTVLPQPLQSEYTALQRPYGASVSWGTSEVADTRRFGLDKDSTVWLSGDNATFSQTQARWNLTGTSARILRVRTKSTRLVFGFVAGLGANKETFQLYENRQAIAPKAFSPEGVTTVVGTTYWVTFNLGNAEEKILDLVFHGVLAIVRVGLDYGSDLPVDIPDQRVGFVCDGLGGSATTSPVDALPVKMALLTGVDFWCEHEEGSGYTTQGALGTKFNDSNKITRMTRFNPKTVVFLGGGVDDGTVAGYSTSVAAVLSLYRTPMPNAKFVAIPSVPGTVAATYQSATLAAYHSAVKTAFDQYQGVTVDTLGYLTTGGIVPSAYADFIV